MSRGAPNDIDWLRTWMPREQARWVVALRATLDDAIAHLQELIFDSGWEQIRATVSSDEEALRASVQLYEARLADLFRFLRAAGAPESPVAWSQLKADLRRTARDSILDITMRTALDQALYAADATPLGEHALYTSWVGALLLFIRAELVSAPPRPGTTDEDARLAWAYAALAHVEDADAFDARFQRFLAEQRTTIEMVTGQSEDAIVTLHVSLRQIPRFDLVLNAGLRWSALTEAG